MWVALLDEAHVHHAQAVAFMQPRKVQISTCPQVEDGVMRVLGHNQITDVYLLALAVADKGCLANLDHRVALRTVVGATKEHLLLM